MKIRRNNILKKSFFIIVVYLCTLSNCLSQTNAFISDTIVENNISQHSLWVFGVFGGLQLNAHSVDFHGLPSVPSCCPNYKSGYGLEPEIGALINYAISPKRDQLIELRLSYNNLGGLLKAREKQLMYYGPNNSIEGVIEHHINTSINYINLTPLFKIKAFNDFFINLGLSFDILIDSKFEQRETLIKPEDLLFENDQRTRMTYSGTIRGLSRNQTAIVGGLSYDKWIKINKYWYLSPEIFFHYGLNNMISEEKWKVYSVKLGLSVNYNKHLQKKEYEETPEIDTIPVTPKKEIEETRFVSRIDTVKTELLELTQQKFLLGTPVVYYDTTRKNNVKTITQYYNRTDTIIGPKEYELTAKIGISAINEVGEVIPFPIFQVEEFLSTRMHPLLNYIFFDENSSEIHSRYQKMEIDEIDKFNINRLFNQNSLEVYYQIMNIVGKRMIEYPKAILTLTGCNSNLANEKNNVSLSKNRAESVRDYLVKAWNISPIRLKVITQNLPNKPSSTTTIEGIEENRRVELSSDELQIISPVITNDTLIKISFRTAGADSSKNQNFNGFRLYTNVFPNTKLNEWKISLLQENDTTKTISGKEEMPIEQDWILKTDSEKQKILSRTMNFVLSVKDFKNKVATDGLVLKIERKTITKKQENREGDKKIDSYSLVLFDFSSTEFTEANKDIPKFIRKLVDKNSTVKVTGYTDRVGDADYNIIISTNRAKAVADAIGHPNTKYEGVGESVLLYNNDLPEGRFYCRTVDIIVETPIQW